MLHEPTAIMAFLILVGCRAPSQPANHSDLVHVDRPDKRTVEVAVRSDDQDLRNLVAACLGIQLRQSKAVVAVPIDGDWRIDVDAAAKPATPDAPLGSVVLTVRVVDCTAAPGSMLDGQGRPTDSILGGTITCALDQVWTSCAAIVGDVEHDVEFRKKWLLEILHRGETDLVDDKEIQRR